MNESGELAASDAKIVEGPFGEIESNPSSRGSFIASSLLLDLLERPTVS